MTPEHVRAVIAIVQEARTRHPGLVIFVEPSREDPESVVVVVSSKTRHCVISSTPEFSLESLGEQIDFEARGLVEES